MTSVFERLVAGDGALAISGANVHEIEDALTAVVVAVWVRCPGQVATVQVPGSASQSKARRDVLAQWVERYHPDGVSANMLLRMIEITRTISKR